MTTPTQRTMKALRDKGYKTGIVERWIMGARVRKDLFGFIDGIAIRDKEILGWQACAGSGLAAHVTKIRDACRLEAQAWLEAGGKIEVWGWRKLKVKRGGKAVRWTPCVVPITTLDTGA